MGIGWQFINIMTRKRPDMLDSKNWNYKHGMANKTKLYHVWASLRQRCSNPNRPDYPNYGGRGITYDPSWESFENFYRDMSPQWRDGLTLDRIDVNGNYERTNCRFVDHKMQANNRRNSKVFYSAGKRMTLLEWSKELGVKRSTLAQRLYVLKWPIDRALTST